MLARRIRAAADALEDAVLERDAAVAAALSARLEPASIARQVHLSVAQVSDIGRRWNGASPA